MFFFTIWWQFYSVLDGNAIFTLSFLSFIIIIVAINHSVWLFIKPNESIANIGIFLFMKLHKKEKVKFKKVPPSIIRILKEKVNKRKCHAKWQWNESFKMWCWKRSIKQSVTVVKSRHSFHSIWNIQIYRWNHSRFEEWQWICSDFHFVLCEHQFTSNRKCCHTK